MRNNKLKTVREHWSHSKIFIGKNRVLAKALGNSEEEEYSDNLHLVSRCLKNECGLLATNQSHEDVMEYFSNLSEPDFARTGGTATDTVELKQGPLALFSHSMEPQLRKLGQCVHTPYSIKTLVTSASGPRSSPCVWGDTSARIILTGGRLEHARKHYYSFCR